jgi:hypothetical protein
MNGIRNMLDLSTAHMPFNPDEQERYQVVHDSAERPYIHDRLKREDSERWPDAASCTRRCEELNQEGSFWGSLRVATHEHGWVVFVPGREYCEDVPEWVRPLIQRALDHDCIVINFDCDAESVDDLPVWEWT